MRSPPLLLIYSKFINNLLCLVSSAKSCAFFRTFEEKFVDISALLENRFIKRFSRYSKQGFYIKFKDTFRINSFRINS
jgi:hypothetical protein